MLHMSSAPFFFCASRSVSAVKPEASQKMAAACCGREVMGQGSGVRGADQG